MTVQLVNFGVSFFDLSWQWINDKEIKELINAPSVSKLEHIAWFEGLQEKKNYIIWGLKYNNQKIGICGLKKVTDNDAEYWGYIGEKDLWGKGIGKQILRLVEYEARKINLQSLRLQVLSQNKRAFKLYLNEGYIIEKELGDLIYMRKEL